MRSGRGGDLQFVAKAATPTSVSSPPCGYFGAKDRSGPWSEHLYVPLAGRGYLKVGVFSSAFPCCSDSRGGGGSHHSLALDRVQVRDGLFMASTPGRVCYRSRA